MMLSGKFSIGSIAVAEARGLALLQVCGQRALQSGGHGVWSDALDIVYCPSILRAGRERSGLLCVEERWGSRYNFLKG